MQVPLCVCLCMHNSSVSLCVFALVSIPLANTGRLHSGELRATDRARPRAKQGPDWSEGPYRAPGGPLMELSLCHVLAVQQPPLLSRTHTECLPVWTTQQFLLSWSRRQREFKGTTVSDRRNTVISAGCKKRSKANRAVWISHRVFNALTSGYLRRQCSKKKPRITKQGWDFLHTSHNQYFVLCLRGGALNCSCVTTPQEEDWK